MSGIFRQYLKEQTNHPNAIIVNRIGDFYEVFGITAKIVADEMDFTLVSRDCGLTERVLMVGFPFCIRDEVVEKLREKYEVCVVENL